MGSPCQAVLGHRRGSVCSSEQFFDKLMMEDSSDSGNSELLNQSTSSDDHQHIKPLTIKIHSPAVNPKLDQLVHQHGKSVTIINSPQLSRASSSMSLASNSADSVRHFSSNYEQLLAQATGSIKKLTREKQSLVAEQDRLLTVNIELADEVKRLLQLDKQNRDERKGLMAANEEFATEVSRLYEEEERGNQERQRLEAEMESLKINLQKQLEDSDEHWEEERRRLECQEQRLLESVKMLSQDNAKLIKEKQDEHISQSKSHQELQSQFEQERVKLEVTISCLKTELEQEKALKHESDSNVIELHKMIERSDQEIENLKDDHQYSTRCIKETYENRIRMLEQKGEKIASENFEYSIENEELTKKLQNVILSQKNLDKEYSQLKVENQWLASSQKKSEKIGGKLEESAREIQELRKELQEEKIKVKNLSEWKSQLADKNKDLKQENTRLQTKLEDLEHLMNDEVTDINEAIKVIKHLQSDKLPVEIGDYKNRKRFM